MKPNLLSLKVPEFVVEVARKSLKKCNNSFKRKEKVAKRKGTNYDWT